MQWLFGHIGDHSYRGDTRLYQRFAPNRTQLYSVQVSCSLPETFKHSRPIEPHNFGHGHLCKILVQVSWASVCHPHKHSSNSLDQNRFKFNTIKLQLSVYQTERRFIHYIFLSFIKQVAPDKIEEFTHHSTYHAYYLSCIYNLLTETGNQPTGTSWDEFSG